MKLLIQIETIHRTYSEPSDSFIVDKEDIEKIKVLLTEKLDDHRWVNAICDSIPFSHGDDTFLISPDPTQIMTTSYRGKIIKISNIK